MTYDVPKVWPKVWRSAMEIKPDRRKASPHAGAFILTWIKWPCLGGVSFLHTMERQTFETNGIPFQ